MDVETTEYILGLKQVMSSRSQSIWRLSVDTPSSWRLGGEIPGRSKCRLDVEEIADLAGEASRLLPVFG